MDIWKDTLTAALVGIERQAPPTIEFAPEALRAALKAFDKTEPESALLGTAATLTLWRQAGYRGVMDDQPAPEPCPADELAPCSVKAAEYLGLMLQGQFAGLLPEWLEAAAAANKRAPPAYLPELLNLGLSRIGLRSRIQPLLGNRGCWLAAQNPDWYYACAKDNDADWQIGGRTERLLLLRRLRAANPTRACERLASTWREEAAKDRAAFLATFAIGLSMSDEPFLEDILDDRSKEVRQTAADLLARLPQSRLMQRMSERTLPLLSLIKPLLGQSKIIISLPQAADPAMLRDGIEPTPPAHLKTGKKAWLLAQLIGATPLFLWSRRWNKAPAQILQAAFDNEWKEALLTGWRRAAQRQGDADWAEALFKAAPETSAAELLDVLPPKRLEAFVLESLRLKPLCGDHPMLPVLLRCEQRWSPELAFMVLQQARRRMGGFFQKADWQLPYHFAKFASKFPPELLDEATQGWPEDAPYWSHWEKAIEEFLNVLRFRHAMLNAIHS